MRLAADTPPRLGLRWDVQVLGGMSARNGEVVLTRFPTRQIAVLLARLAMYPLRSHSREELGELLWPEAAAELQRNRLRHALSTLRRLLERPGDAAGTCFAADRQYIRVNPGAFACDAIAFEEHARARNVAAALSCYRGELLPGFYDEWVLEDRERLAALHHRLDGAAPAAASRHPADATPPPPARSGLRERSLPGYLTAFFGRSAELERLTRLVDEHRLVTLSGPGGCGKTRLATEMASRLPGFDSITFVALAECRQPEQIVEHVRLALGFQAGLASTLDQIAGSLCDQRALLILDNVEQLVNGATIDVLTSLLQRLPRVHLLLTSRRALQRPEERELVLLPLPLPERDADLGDAARNPGISLFVDRARAVRADYHVGAGNVRMLADVCHALDGLPLALEIAASRIRTYSPREICEALKSGIGVLARSGPRGAREGRHSSLTQAIGWSWQLLGRREQRLLTALTVFRGGWTADAARAVSRSADCHELLESLCVDSLLQSAPGADGQTRFSMLASVRDFACDPARRAGLRASRRRHRAWCLARAALDSGSGHRLDELDLPDAVEAMGTALDDGEPAVAVSLALAWRGHWLATGATPEALAVLRRIGDESTAAGAAGTSDVFALLARLLVKAGHPDEALARASRALQLAGDDAALRAEALLAQASVRWAWRREGAAVIDLAREAAQLAETAGTPRLRVDIALLQGALSLWHLGEPAAAASLFTQAAAIAQARGDGLGALPAWPGLVACRTALGEHRAAIDLALAGIERATELGHVETQVLLLNRLSLGYEKTRQFARALDVCRREVRLARRHGMVYHTAYGLWNQCRPLARLRQGELSAVMMAFSQRFWTGQFGELDANDQRSIAKMRRLLSAQIGPARWQACWERGLTMPLREGLELGGA